MKESRTAVEPIEQYLAAVREAVDRFDESRKLAIRKAAEACAGAILRGRLVHVFGTGHSRMAVEEVFPRYGSYPGFHPIVELSMTFHNPVVGANGQRQAMFLENVQGFGKVLWKNFATSPDDALLAISSGGSNAVTVDVAIEAKRLGMTVIALTSLANAEASASKHESGKRLHEVADLVLDHGSPAGDAVVWVEGLKTPVAPLSTVTSAIAVNLLKAECARILSAAGRPPLALTSPHFVGREESQRLFEAAYDDYRKRIGILYR